MSEIQDAYEKIGADYNDVVRRLTSEALVVRFAGKFLQDNSFENLRTALANNDVNGAFLASHTLKGIAQNMGFSNLFEPSNALTEFLRPIPETAAGSEELFAADRGHPRRPVGAVCNREQPLTRSARCDYRAERARLVRIRYHCFE